MTTEVHSIHFIVDPAPAGLGPEFEGMGLLLISDDTGQHASAVVEHDFAETVIAARYDLTGPVVLGSTAIRWLRTGWPQEWEEDPNPTWAPVYPSGAQA